MRSAVIFAGLAASVSAWSATTTTVCFSVLRYYSITNNRFQTTKATTTTVASTEWDPWTSTTTVCFTQPPIDSSTLTFRSRPPLLLPPSGTHGRAPPYDIHSSLASSTANSPVQTTKAKTTTASTEWDAWTTTTTTVRLPASYFVRTYH
jgi:hypothetical protein